MWIIPNHKAEPSNKRVADFCLGIISPHVYNVMILATEDSVVHLIKPG